jgi:predicted Mrr-cat superfamily restriction endonuclease
MIYTADGRREDREMNLYDMKLKADRAELIPLFLEHNFVCIGWPGIGDLENVSEDELKSRFVQAYDFQGGVLAESLEEIRTFVHTMQDGDYVLVSDEDWAYLGDLGDYYYLEHHDNREDGMCHRRGVTWMTRIPLTKLNPKVQDLLNSHETIAKFEYDFVDADLHRWLADGKGLAGVSSDNASGQPVHIDSDMIERALTILKEAMSSDDPERRERAAAAILQYASLGRSNT